MIYACGDHRVDAEEWITAGGLVPEAAPVPPGHARDPWPCGHITAYDAEGEGLIPATREAAQ